MTKLDGCQVSESLPFGLLVLFFVLQTQPNFLGIEKKIKEIFFNFIFLFPSDSSQYSTGVQLCFLVLSFLLLPG